MPKTRSLKKTHKMIEFVVRSEIGTALAVFATEQEAFAEAVTRSARRLLPMFVTVEAYDRPAALWWGGRAAAKFYDLESKKPHPRGGWAPVRLRQWKVESHVQHWVGVPRARGAR